MKKLLKSLQEYTRIDEAKDKEHLSLKDILENIEFNLHQNLKEKNVELLYPKHEVLLNVYQESFQN